MSLRFNTKNMFQNNGKKQTGIRFLVFPSPSFIRYQNSNTATP